MKKKYDDKKRQILARLMIGSAYKKYRSRLASTTLPVWITRKIRYINTFQN